jgi:uncharacterized membrane protein YkoI
VNGKAVNKEVTITSGEEVAKAAKQRVNGKVVNVEMEIKDVKRKPGTKESWWQNLE